MLRVRCIRIWPGMILLALLLSLFNALLILVYLGPSHYNNPNSRSVPVYAVSSKIYQRDPDFKTATKAHSVTLLKKGHDRTWNRDIDRNSEVTYMATKWKDDHNRNSIGGDNGAVVEVFTNWSSPKSSFKRTSENVDLPHIQSKLKLNREVLSMIGKPPNKPVDVVIGIPTVKRTNANYLSSTLRQLVSNLDEAERNQSHIVVFSANFEPNANEETAGFIGNEFKEEVTSGLIEVIKPDKAFYPKLTNLPQLWKDKPDRIMWRSKQSVDYALLFSFCESLGYYYLHLEDDVSVSPTYFREIKNFIRARRFTKWSNLQFGTSGFIGMLYKTSDLRRLALFVKMYYWIFPVDILFRHFNDIHLYGNSPADVYSPPLFRHLGAQSSLKGQTRRLEAAKEKKQLQRTNVRKYTDSVNPPGFLYTNIEVFQAYTIDGPYRKLNIGYFWGRNVHLLEYVILELTHEVTLRRVVIETGSYFAPNDFMAGGKLEITGPSEKGGCHDEKYTLLTNVVHRGKIEAISDKLGGIPHVKCVKLTITKLNRGSNGITNWLLIREVAVWSH